MDLVLARPLELQVDVPKVLGEDTAGAGHTDLPGFGLDFDCLTEAEGRVEVRDGTGGSWPVPSEYPPPSGMVMSDSERTTFISARSLGVKEKRGGCGVELCQAGREEVRV